MPSFASLHLNCHSTGYDAALAIGGNVVKLTDLLDECTETLALIAEMMGIDGSEVTPAMLKSLLQDGYQIVKR